MVKIYLEEVHYDGSKNKVKRQNEVKCKTVDVCEVELERAVYERRICALIQALLEIDQELSAKENAMTEIKEAA